MHLQNQKCHVTIYLRKYRYHGVKRESTLAPGDDSSKSTESSDKTGTHRFDMSGKIKEEAK